MSLGDDLGSLRSVGPAGSAGSRPLPGSPANLIRRGVAVAVDLTVTAVVVVGPLVALDRILTAASVPDDPAGTIWLTSAAAWLLAFVLLYSPLGLSRWGATPGKRLLNLEVVKAGGAGRIGYGAAVLRRLSNLVLALVPVFLIANVSAINLSERKQGMHERAAGSAVIVRRR